ncbi:unnamed protein product [Blepharisma stoltei]|uniref:Uncharacterized protein n=1 Tax=Blepharisma stoltei TaxID=1481888 RepID=A0AAU9IFS0_9CILI|nr:unnamed protein product [Blepharisma stoltei]
MIGFMNTTEDAKKLIFEANDTTRKTTFILLGTLAIIFIHLGLSVEGTGAAWECELDNSSPKHLYICKQLRQSASCRTLTGPLKAEILLNSNNEVKASAYIVCPWENAMTELRICFALGAGMALFIGLFSLMKEDKKLAEFHINSTIFFSLLLAIAATFDLFAISDSRNNNYAMCNLTNDFELQEGIVGEKIECTHTIYQVTGYLGYVAGGLLLVSAYYMKNWKNNLTLD